MVCLCHYNHSTPGPLPHKTFCTQCKVSRISVSTRQELGNRPANNIHYGIRTIQEVKYERCDRDR